MKSNVFLVEVLTGDSVNVYMVRDGRGKVILATQHRQEFIDFIENPDPYPHDEEQDTTPNYS